MSVRVIETTYHGVTYRSRLEARWAVFFDALHLHHEYEAEAFTDGNRSYLPDFHVPSLKTFFECKPEYPGLEEVERARIAGEATEHRVIIVCGPPTAPERHHFEYPGLASYDYLEINGPHYLAHPGWDNYYAWCECPDCGVVGIEYEARAGRLCGCYPGNDKVRTPLGPRLQEAYAAARKKRFWMPQQAA